MATVLEFPSRSRRGLNFLEEQVKALLAARGADDELMEFAAHTVREIYQRSTDAENYSFSLTLPDSLDAEDIAALEQALETGIESIRAENHAIVVRLVAELALTRLKLFQLERG